MFRFTRLGDLSAALTVSFTVGGTATSGTDYNSLGTSVSIGSGKGSADVPVGAIHDGVTDEDETVSVTVGSGTGYSVGGASSDSLEIIDTDLLPQAFDTWVTTSVNEATDVAVLDLSTDLDGDELEVTAVTQGDYGTVTINLDGTVTYTPDTDFVGDDSFTYTVEDEFGNDSTGTITVTVTEPLAPPTSLWVAKSTLSSSSSVNIDAAAMAIDPDGDGLEVTSVTQGSHGSVAIETDGTVTYTPDTNYTGQDSFTYTVEDPDGNEATNTITVTVGPTDPVALDDEVATPVNTGVEVDVLELSWQPLGGSLTVTAITQGSHGTVVDNLDGTVTYTPDTNYTGTDTFTYTVTDAYSNTATGTITVTVGTPPPGLADELLADLGDIDDEIENYDDDSPDAILGMLPDAEVAGNDYLDNMASFISANNVETVGTDKSIRDFVGAMWTSYKQRLYGDYLTALGLEAFLWDLLVATKNRMDSIANQRAAELQSPNPSGATIELLTAAYVKLGDIHGALVDLWGKVDLQMRTKSYDAAFQAWKALVAGYPPAVQLVFAPPAPPQRDVKDILPK